MSATALYTFGLLDPAVEPDKLADFVKLGGEILTAADDAPGFLGRADPADDHWGPYVLPDIPEFEGHDRTVHIATLSLWRDWDSARAFVYNGLHRDALRLRYDWFLKGPWPGYVHWQVPDGETPTWQDGVTRYSS